MTWEEQDRIFKAINNVSKKVNDMQAQLDRYFSDKHKENAEAINVTEDAIIELASLIDDTKGGQE